MSTPVYQSWIDVPDHLVLASQLEKFDLPRVACGPVRAVVRTYNAIGKRDEFALYDMRESIPSPGSATVLQAAAARRDRVYVCADCGANTEAELGWHHPCRRGCRNREHQRCSYVGRRCAMCRRVAVLAAAARAAVEDRATVTEWARRRLEQDAVLVRVATVYPAPATSPSGRRRPAIGWRVDAVTAHGEPLRLPPIARASTKAPGLGPGALDLATGAAELHAALAGRVIIPYTTGEQQQLDTLLATHGREDRAPTPSFTLHFRQQLTSWRGLIDPDTGRWTLPLDPGPADRCALLLRRMAQTVPDTIDTVKQEGT